MGNAFGGSFSWPPFKIEAKILLFGLDSAGKTAILYRLKFGSLLKTTSTVGTNVERIDYKSWSFLVWDFGGHDKSRPLWRSYFDGGRGAVYVVDSTDRQRLIDARKDMHGVLGQDELRNLPVLIMANKQDAAEALNVQEISEALDVSSLIQKQRRVQKTSAVTGEGIYEGLDWLLEALQEIS
eukprot:CAMPEP_0196658880 /NCGR_PEP_ID=MMETSP1086-20130531/32109_1 /TAXON_ID=77921 /ORGANISM="Cyanoptyche  gloeocystis , Strain SAG4.97" /LENGTH=181 /DNA_ID=CAMNT_0041992657 /DNA_START=183 /DNA_END=728 /DNA_ORIENTATION=+